ncbi:hypothetical protein [Pseudonocardia sp. HH130630-07]|uniref:hypothetical protein n=1 Tax=Pseudonocardia sp. HH130630-07 TaxID=1690815 RepID=UPI000814E3A1|nr:hypothetical protein [Pseudonocardia sp. HH130630-07]ANY09508.1 hypothetical protein AFB00_28370 [Pseudonocardia sp. HH130630-07]
MTPRAVVLVEGASDAAAIETLARRGGRPVDGVAIVVLHGYTNLGSALRALAPAAPARVTVLCDAGAEAWVRRALGEDGRCRVCHTDLEDELIRALGVERVREIVAGQGELTGLQILERQPAHRDRSPAQHLHRFLGTRSGRKERYGALLAAALAPEAVPAPLRAVLDDLGL